MTDNNKTKSNDSLKKYLWISLAFHGFALILFSGVLNFGSKDEIILPQVMKVDIIGSPADLPPVQKKLPPPPKVKKPEIKPEPSKKIPPKEKVVEKVSDAPKVNLEQKKKEEEKKKKEKEKAEEIKKEEQEKKLKNKQNEAMNKLKQNEALENLKNTQEPEPPEPVKGDRITPGSFSGGLDSIQFNKYYNDLKLHLFNYWSVPGWLSELDLKAQALVVLDSRGYVIKREIIKSSGNPNFDNTILAAIDKSSPFPLPPDRLSSRVENKEIVFGFPEN